MFLVQVYAQFCAVKEGSISTANVNVTQAGKEKNVSWGMMNAKFPTAMGMGIVLTENVTAFVDIRANFAKLVRTYSEFKRDWFDSK